MDLLKGMEDKYKIVRIICLVDLIQPAMIILARAWLIIFRSVPNDVEAYAISDHNSSVVIIFAFVICFYVIHLSIALKLLSALELMELDPLASARNAKAWQSWSIIFLFFLIGSLISNILTESAKLAIAFGTIVGICEIVWRLFGIYYVGLFIDVVVTRIPTTVKLVPTVQFFGVRFPITSESRDIDHI